MIVEQFEESKCYGTVLFAIKTTFDQSICLPTEQPSIEVKPILSLSFDDGIMLKLFYVIVGEKSNAFSVTIDGSECVDDLMSLIKAKKFNTITCDANQQQLFLAKNGHAWLSDRSQVFT